MLKFKHIKIIIDDEFIYIIATKLIKLNRYLNIPLYTERETIVYNKMKTTFEIISLGLIRTACQKPIKISFSFKTFKMSMYVSPSIMKVYLRDSNLIFFLLKWRLYVSICVTVSNIIFLTIWNSASIELIEEKKSF